MALSDRTPTTFKTNLFIPAVYAATVVKAAKKNLVCFDAIDSSWRSNLKKGDTLYIGKTNVVTATEVVVGSNGSALNPFNTTGITLVINQWYEAPVYIDDMSLHQTQVDAEAQAAEEAAYAVDLRIDTSVATLFSALNGGSLPGQSDGQTFTSDLAEDLVETLQEADVPWDGNISLITDPSGLSDMLKIDKLLSADFAGLKGILVNGVIGASSLVWGAKVRVTNNLVAATTGSYGVLMHKKAIAGAAQLQKAWTEEFKREHRTLIQSEALWGVIELQDNFGIPFYTRKA